MLELADRRRPSVLIVGASTRAAAQSAIRAGLNPICADLFADLDLRACARVLELADYPRGLVTAAAAAPACPWMYTGGLENHPGLVGRISQARPLWGNGPDVLRRVRDPWHVRQLLDEAGLPALQVRPRQPAPPAADGAWMIKPLRGAAGRGIGVWDGSPSHRATLRMPHYFQERRGGTSISAVYLAAPTQTYLLGITRQLIGLKEVHAPPFTWCGTITPVALPDEIIVAVRKIGDVLTAQTGLQGLFGCDFLVADGQPWLTEVNPRYPASTELVEHVLQVPLVDRHHRAFVVPPSGGAPRKAPEGGTTNGPVLGKIVLYADRDLVAPDLARFVSRPSSWLETPGTYDRSLPYLADIPDSGQPISRGQPICTVFARGKIESECLARLLRRAARLERRIP
ncbi:MAG: ATP-grasp domain-containing protein [Deltaproteobacteria bacterium]